MRCIRRPGASWTLSNHGSASCFVLRHRDFGERPRHACHRQHAYSSGDAYAGLGTGILLIVIYAVLGYVGVVSGSIASVNPATDTGATVLTNLTASLFGTFGMVFLGIVFVIACLNVCTGLICTCATYFHTRFATIAGRRVSYRAWQALFTVSVSWYPTPDSA